MMIRKCKNKVEADHETVKMGKPFPSDNRRHFFPGRWEKHHYSNSLYGKAVSPVGKPFLRENISFIGSCMTHFQLDF